MPTPPKEDHLWDAWCAAQLRQDHIDIMRLWKRIPARVDEWFGDLPFGINAAGTTTTTTTTTTTSTTTTTQPPVVTTTTTTTTCSCGAFGTTIISDTFTDSDSTPITSHSPDVDTVGGGWSIFGGSIEPDIQSNQLSYGDDTTNNAFTLIDSGVSDGDLSVTFTGDIDDADAVANLLFRINTASPTQNRMQLFANPSGVFLFKLVSGSFTQIGSSSPLGNGTHTLRVEFCCNSITVFANASQIISVTESANQNNTGVGVLGRAGSSTGKTVTFDNFLFKGE